MAFVRIVFTAAALADPKIMAATKRLIRLLGEFKPAPTARERRT